MRPIARQSARLAHCNGKRQICERRQHNCQRNTFHTSTRTLEPASNNRPDQPSSSNERREPQKASQYETRLLGKAAEGEQGEAKTFSENRKPGLKRNLRQQRRVNEVPEPPPIPEWFLQHNVKLARHDISSDFARSKEQMIRCIDTQTGHTLFTVPYYSLPREVRKSDEAGQPAQSKTEQLSRDAAPLTRNEGAPNSTQPPDNAVSSTLAENVGGSVSASDGIVNDHLTNPHSKSTPSSGNVGWSQTIENGLENEHKPDAMKLPNPPEGPSKKVKTPENGKKSNMDSKISTSTPIKGKPALYGGFFDAKFQMGQPSADKHQIDVESPKLEAAHGQKPDAIHQLASKPEANSNEHASPALRFETTEFVPPKALLYNSYEDPIRWVFLEAETSLRAALCISKNGQRSSSFASDRVDISLQCPDANCHDDLDCFVKDLAKTLDADIIRLDANDLAELTEDFVGQGHDDLGSFATLSYDVFDGYEVTEGRLTRPSEQSEDEENEGEEDEAREEQHDPKEDARLAHPASLADLKRIFQDGQNHLNNTFSTKVIGIGIGGLLNTPQIAMRRQPSQLAATTQNSDTTRDEARLTVLLDHLLDAPKQKRVQILSDEPIEQRRSKQLQEIKDKRTETDAQSKVRSHQRMLRARRQRPVTWLSYTAITLMGYLSRALRGFKSGSAGFALLSDPPSMPTGLTETSDAATRTIVHVRDLRDLFESRVGETIINRLAKIVRKRRRGGEQIVIVGTTAQDVPGPYRMTGDPSDEFPFRAINVAPFFNFDRGDETEFENLCRVRQKLDQKSLTEQGHRKIMEINMRHVQSMLRRLRPLDKIDLLSEEARMQMDMPKMAFLAQRVLSIDQVQRLVLVAIGLSQSHAFADTITPLHVALASYVATRTDAAESSFNQLSEQKVARKPMKERQQEDRPIDRLKKICNSHETRLLGGMVNPANIKTGFTDVHAPVETIEALKTLTTLSLLRPEAFKYGVLASDRIPGLLLYGPPGTGKTLLAKAVAKESKATVLEVSGAQIYDKYVGEGEKMVKAVFSLAKKLSPCVVFIDEADAIFGSRSNAGNRNTHRDIINQFLREWDGMDDHGVFIMVATNRPFDLDDAVLRRLPRRLLVDLPVVKDRESILGIHLKNEDLDSTVSISALAEQTPLYSGSDLKNVSVSAALACVREENELAEKNKDNKEFKLPEKRTLSARHFDAALVEISASISENMPSLAAIRKFDEQYGDRKGRRKKTAYGFGSRDESVQEGAARVRQP